MRLRPPPREAEPRAREVHRPRRVRPTWRLVLLLLVGIIAVNVLILGQRLGPVADVLGLSGDDGEGVAEAVDAFFERYVGAEGRVIRLDQGGDTVSEGQAYAMLMAAGMGDRERFDLVWRWTREHLQRPDGLLAFHWSGGAVVDEAPATDADLDAARALLVAAERFDVRAYRREAVRIGRAVLRDETARAAGEPVLLAGPWARPAPFVVNPSYIDPRAFGALGSVTDPDAWDELASASRGQLAVLVDVPPHLPPDWARVDDAGVVAATGPPAEPSAAPRFGLDAARVLVRLGVDCAADGRRLSASAWPFFEDRDPGRVAIAYDLEGEPAAEGSHPTMLVAAAGAARAAGDPEGVERYLDAAVELEALRPTYYGAAWVALGRMMLTTDRLGSCGDPADP